MIAFFNTPVRRIVFFIALSALIHALILWLPNFHLPHSKVQLPPLTVRLEQLPQLPQPNDTLPEAPLALGEGNAVTSAFKPVKPMVAMKPMRASTDKPPFPQHLQLTFTVYRGESATNAGEIFHHLEIEQDQYTLTALRVKQQLSQTSHGKLNQNGLQPDYYTEERITASKQHTQQATFDWINHKLHFSNHAEAALSDGTQDVLSIMYQLSQLPLHAEYFTQAISDAEQLIPYQIEIGAIEEIDTAMGKLKARHLRQMHTQNEAYFEIWIAPEYRMLPVKFRQMDANETLIEEVVVSDIRIAEK